jgi:hypothetical protein
MIRMKWVISYKYIGSEVGGEGYQGVPKVDLVSLAIYLQIGVSKCLASRCESLEETCKKDCFSRNVNLRVLLTGQEPFI